MGLPRMETPLRILRSSVNKNVLVRVKDGNLYYGRLVLTDPTMNLVITNCEELSEELNKPSARYGTVLIRGSQILYIVIGYEK